MDRHQYQFIELESNSSPLRSSSEPQSSTQSSRFHYPSPTPNPSPNFIPAPENATPLRQLSPEPPDDDGLSEYRTAARLFLSSYDQKLRGLGPAPSTSTAIVPVPVPFSATATAIIPVPTDLTISTYKKRKLPKRSGEMVRASFADTGDLLISRDQVRRTRITFEALRSLVIRDVQASDRAMPGLRNRPDAKAAALMKERDLYLYRDRRIIGTIPGIYIGDIFYYRWELLILGIHGQTQAGIDTVAGSKTSTGKPIATSIVVSGGYEDDEDGGDVLIYTGQGGREGNAKQQTIDQKLEGGNLALEQSMQQGIEIRVIRGLKSDRSPSGKVYVYDGLYTVVEYWFDVGKSGFSVYKYKLERIKGQVEMGSVMLRLAENVKRNPDVRVASWLSHDMSKGKEKLPVSLFNDVDDRWEPMDYEYRAGTVYSRISFQDRKNGSKDVGCGCVSICSSDCYCARRNGGEFAYDMNGVLIKGKGLIYECGPLCSCPQSCSNRVTQKGMRNQLEVFRSPETDWGVRPLDLIPAGSFICEFTGVVLTKNEADLMTDSCLIDPSSFPARWLQWGDLSAVFPEYVPPDFPPLPELNYSMDVTKLRNVACYLTHSRSPNVFLQYVLFDHYNELYPHLMVFAMENIPPFRELSIDYGM